jgi:hypothetical protein
MNNELVTQEHWWKRNWKWAVPIVGTIMMAIVIFFSSGMNLIVTDLVQAYADTKLYEYALEKAKSNDSVIELLGEIEAIENLAILEGEVHYTNENKTVNATIGLKGTKGKAKMDITANRINDKWSYKKINIRIKNPPEKKQTIELITK